VQPLPIDRLGSRGARPKKTKGFIGIQFADPTIGGIKMASAHPIIDHIIAHHHAVVVRT
jgi:hypothetical protein